MKDILNLSIDGHVKIWDPTTGEVLVSKHNAINSETMSMLIASALVGADRNYIYEMHFGNGGAVIDSTGNITYKDVLVNLDTNGRLAGLFSPTYFKVVDTRDEQYNTDPSNNNVADSHLEGSTYTDVIVTCTLNQDEPAAGTVFNLTSGQVNQYQSDNAQDFSGEFVFNELGLKAKDPIGTLATGPLLSHIVFHPVQKSANRVIQIVYTLRIRIV